MFERFTDRARRVVVLAQEHARVEGAEAIDLKHLVMGMSTEGEGVAAKVLAALHCGLEVGEPAPAPTDGHIPFSSSAKRSLDLAQREALQLGYAYIGTEHLLLGALRVSAESDEPLFTDHDTIRGEVIKVLREHAVKEGVAASTLEAKAVKSTTTVKTPRGRVVVEADEATIDNGMLLLGRKQEGVSKTVAVFAAGEWYSCVAGSSETTP